MKKVLCYLRTVKEINNVVQIYIATGGVYIAHDYVEQKPYKKDNNMYYPLKCKTCNHVSASWRKV